MQISGSVSLDSKLADCVVGEEKQIVLTVVPIKNDKSGFSADVIALEHYDEGGAEDKAPTDESPSKPLKKVPGGTSEPSEHVLMIGVGKMKPKAY